MPSANLLPLISNTNLYLILMVIISLAVLFLLAAIISRAFGRNSTETKLLESQKKASEIIESAIKESQKIISRASLQENELLTVFKAEIGKIEQSYQKAVEESFTALKGRMEQRILDTENSYSSYLKDLEERASSQIKQNQSDLEQRTSTFFSQSQTLLQNFIKELQSSTETQIDKEIGNAKRIVNDYKNQRMEIIDENIVAILEKALNVVIAKKLTLGDQTELVYESLEQAKKDNIFT